MTQKYEKNIITNIVCIDPTSYLFGKYVRVKIAVDITKPLIKGVHVVIGDEKLWLPTKFEALPTFALIVDRWDSLLNTVVLLITWKNSTH